MPGPLKFYKRDPDGKGRGGGLYYHRGEGEHSKYTTRKDREYHSRRKHLGRFKRGKKWRKEGKIGSGVYRHTHDTRKRGLTSKLLEKY